MSDRIDDLQESLRGVTARLDNLSACLPRVYSVEKELGGLHKAIYGNGRAGLSERLAHVEQQMRTLTWTVRLVGGALVTGVVGIAVKLIIG